MNEALVFLWICASFVAPITAALWHGTFSPLKPRVAWALAGVGIGAVAVGVAPFSLPGHAWDYGLSAIAYGCVCIATSALPNTYFLRMASIVGLLVLAIPVAIGALFAAPPNLSRTVRLQCDQRVRFESWGWVATGGEAAVVLWQPPWFPVEIERARRQFDWDAYPELNGETRFSASSRGACGVTVEYDGRVVWKPR